jgi:hypothetical protein
MRYASSCLMVCHIFSVSICWKIPLSLPFSKGDFINPALTSTRSPRGRVLSSGRTLLSDFFHQGEEVVVDYIVEGDVGDPFNGEATFMGTYGFDGCGFPDVGERLIRRL